MPLLYLSVLAQAIFRFYLSWIWLVASARALSALDSIGQAGGSYLWQTTPRRHSPHCILSQAHAEAGCLWTEAFHSSVVMCSVWCVLSGCCLPLHPHCWPFRDGWDSGSDPSRRGRTGLVRVPVLVRNYHLCVESISKQADPRRRSEGKLEEHSIGGLVSLPVQAIVSWL